MEGLILTKNKTNKHGNGRKKQETEIWCGKTLVVGLPLMYNL